MSRRIRNCIECRECHTRYLIGSSPFHNGSYFLSKASGPATVRLYCCCSFHLPQDFKMADLRDYAVSEWAHERGYGSADEIVMLAEEKKLAG